MSYSLRPIEPTDIEVARTIASSIRAEFLESTEKSATQMRLGTREDLRDLDEVEKRYLRNGGIFYVMTDRGRIIGTGGIKRFSDEICELRQLYFLRPYRGRGLGHEMALSLIEWARECGYKTTRLTLLKNQADAKKLFCSLGFMETTVADEQDGPETTDELRLELNLLIKSRRKP